MIQIQSESNQFFECNFQLEAKRILTHDFSLLLQEKEEERVILIKRVTDFSNMFLTKEASKISRRAGPAAATAQT